MSCKRSNSKRFYIAFPEGVYMLAFRRGDNGFFKNKIWLFSKHLPRMGTKPKMRKTARARQIVLRFWVLDLKSPKNGKFEILLP
jgi:hypothetical protein